MIPTPYTYAQRWEFQGFALSPSAEWEGQQIAEMTTVDMGDGTLRCYYAAGPAAKIGTATSEDGIAWSKHESYVLEDAGRPFAVRVGSKIHLFYNDLASNPTGSIKYVTSTDGVTFGAPVMILEETEDDKWANLRIAKNRNRWAILIESSPDAGGVWRTGRASASSLLGPWEVDDRVIDSYMLASPAGSASPGCLHFVNGRWCSWPWMQPGSGTIDGVTSELYFTSSADLENWTFPKRIIRASGYKTSDGVTDVRQFADVQIQEFNGEAFLYHSGVFGGEIDTVGCDVWVWKFPGTLKQLLSDIGEGWQPIAEL